MRMTNSMMVNTMLWNTNRNLNSMSELNNQLSTGKKIHRPSDDPVGTTFVMKYKTDIRETKQYQDNVRDALGWMEATESALHNMKDIMQRIRELTVQAANGTNSPSDRANIQVEIDEYVKELRVLGNSTSAGRYLFSGLNTDQKLFEGDDAMTNINVNASGSNNVKSFEVSVGEVIPVGTHPNDVFSIDPITRESFLIRDIMDLSAAIGSDDDAGIQVGLGKMDEHIEKVLFAMGEIGGKVNRLEFIHLRLKENEYTFTGLLDDVANVDMAEAIMHFQNLENVYRASLSVGAKVIQPSLVDFIR